MEELEKIREAEAASHMQAYGEHDLFAPGSWLAKPVKTVLELLPLLEGGRDLRVLDLGSGVGRNAIPAARALDCRVDCVDILPLAIELLEQNAARWGVAEKIQGILCPIDGFEIEREAYDLILGISALEHMDSETAFGRKLAQIREGTRDGGLVCLVVNSGVREWDKATGRELRPQFEVNMETEALLALLRGAFSGWEVLKETVVHQAYEIPRETGPAQLRTDVVTWVGRCETW